MFVFKTLRVILDRVMSSKMKLQTTFLANHKQSIVMSSKKATGMLPNPFILTPSKATFKNLESVSLFIGSGAMNRLLSDVLQREGSGEVTTVGWAQKQLENVCFQNKS